MFKFLDLKPESFGLDISDLSLKIIKLKKKREILGLDSFGKAEIKPGIIQEGEIKDPDTLSEIIKEGIEKVKGRKIKTKYVICSLPEEKAFIQVIKMPKMKEEEMRTAVNFEAENYIPLPINEVYLDFQVVPPLYDHLDHTDVLIAALPKKVIDPYVATLKKTGLIPLALEIESQGISRALIKNEVTSQPVLLIDLGATRTSFIIFSGYALRFTSSIPVSSQKFTEAIAKGLKISLKKAEQIKREYDLMEKSTNKEKAAVFEILVPALTDLIEQIKTRIDYYETHSSHEHLPPDGKGVSKIILCGGGANFKGLTTFLSLELKIPVELGNPWINILPQPLKRPPEISFEESLGYTTAIGLALRGLKEK